MPIIDSTTGLPIRSKGAAQTDTDGDTLYTIYYGETAPVQVVPNIQTGCIVIDGGGADSHTDTSGYQTPQMLLDGGHALSCSA